MIGAAGLSDFFQRISQDERNRDVRKHLRYALERKDSSLDPNVVKQLLAWDAANVDRAQLGMPAPDFQLSTVSGQTMRLSDFRGNRCVVLVFIYGDT